MGRNAPRYDTINKEHCPREEAMKTMKILALVSAAMTPAQGYIYNAPQDNVDLAWLVLGNGQGQLLAVENPVGLPIISTLRSPASGHTVINGQTQLSIAYQTSTLPPPFNRRSPYSPWQVCFSDGMQPVVCYEKDGVQQAVWPMDMVPVAREWVQDAEIVRTIIGNADFELTVEDFVAGTRDELVRTFTVKNLMSTPTSYRIVHFAPINPSGRSVAPWAAGWRQIDAVNSCAYNAAGDCLLFTDDNSSWWVMGADQPSTGHQCGVYQSVVQDIADGTLGGASSAGPAVVEGALSYDSPSLGQNETYTVSAFVTQAAGSAQTAAQTFSNTHGGSTAADLRASTVTFWHNWLASGSSGSIGDPDVRALVRRLLVVLKASMWDNGGISAVPAELSPFYTRDAMPPARALALFGHIEEAKRMLLALEAYLTRSHNMNFQAYDASISGVIDAGFSESTTFSNITAFSMDDPALIVHAIGDVWRIDGRSDNQFAAQTWPFVKHLISMGERDMGPIGVIAQNNGFQDDMLHWAFNREGAGIECSYFNMLWVSALELAAEMGTALGHTTEAADYAALASSIRTAIEENFWNEDLQRYAYIRVPDGRTVNGGHTEVPDGRGGRYIFPTSALAHGASYPHWCGYADDARTRASLAAARDNILPLPDGDLVMASFSPMTAKLTRTFYGLARTDDPALGSTKDWFLSKAPLGGMPEVFPTGNRAIQTWMCGETLIALHAYLAATGTPVAQSRLSPQPMRISPPVSRELFSLTGQLLPADARGHKLGIADGCYVVRGNGVRRVLHGFARKR
ncbi:MAG: hypothetical protein GF331_12535 [Chitinivibrionales bacterium]|nr:hypothetical protein [Chitinivibrionales bacterium]